MIRRALFLGLALAAAIGLAVLLRDLVREALVEPLAYLLWLVRLELESLPQAIAWVALIVIGLLLAGRSLVAGAAPARRAAPGERDYAGQVEATVRWLNLTTHGDYYKWRLAQRLSELALEALAQREQIGVEEARRRLDDGRLDVPPDIRAYLQAGLQPDYFGRLPRPRWRWRLRAPSSSLDLAPETVVRFLETQLEAERDYRDR